MRLNQKNNYFSAVFRGYVDHKVKPGKKHVDHKVKPGKGQFFFLNCCFLQKEAFAKDVDHKVKPGRSYKV